MQLKSANVINAPIEAEASNLCLICYTAPRVSVILNTYETFLSTYNNSNIKI